MLIKTKKLNCYMGDKSIQIQAVSDNGSIIGLFNIERVTKNKQTYYETDRLAYTFATIAEAKQFALDNITWLLN